MYTATSKQQEDSTYKDSHPKCFITTNFDKFHREDFAKGDEGGEILRACFRHFPLCFHFNFFASITIKLTLKYRDAGTGGQEGQLPPLPFARRGKGVKSAL